MKKVVSILLGCALAILCSCLFLGCSDEAEQPMASVNDATGVQTTGEQKLGMGSFIQINDRLICDEQTRIVYYTDQQGLYLNPISPYYSENGRLCRFVDGRIVEIES